MTLGRLITDESGKATAPAIGGLTEAAEIKIGAGPLIPKPIPTGVKGISVTVGTLVGS